MTPLRFIFQFAIALKVPWVQAPLLFKARCSGVGLSGARGIQCRVQTPHSSGKNLGFEFLPVYRLSVHWDGR